MVDAGEPGTASPASVSAEPPAGATLVPAAVWVARDYPVFPNFLERIREGYGAAVEASDFAGDPAGEVERINGWVAEATEGRIDNLLGPDALNSLPRLVLTTALVYDGTWLVPFQEKYTRPRPFHTL